MTKPNLIPEKIAILKQAKEEIRLGNATGLCSAIVIGRTVLKEIFTPDEHAGLVEASAELSMYIYVTLRGYSWLGK